MALTSQPHWLGLAWLGFDNKYNCFNVFIFIYQQSIMIFKYRFVVQFHHIIQNHFLKRCNIWRCREYHQVRVNLKIILNI